MSEITESEWLRALETASQDDEGLSIQELMRITGYGRDKVSRLLRNGVREGKIAVGHKMYKRMDRISIRIPCYRVIE